MTEEKGRSLFAANVPKDLQDAVVRWLKSASTYRHKDSYGSPDWPAVVRWARDYPVQAGEEWYGFQQSTLAIDESIRLSPWLFRVAFYLRVLRRALRGDSRIARAPGGRMLSFGRLILGEQRAKLMLEPHIADVHEEYFAALKAGDTRRAKLIMVRGHLSSLRILAEPFRDLLEWCAKLISLFFKD